MPASESLPVMMASASCSAQDKKMADQAAAAAHWDAAYAQGDDTQSWSEKHPGMSLRMLVPHARCDDPRLVGVLVIAIGARYLWSGLS